MGECVSFNYWTCILLSLVPTCFPKRRSLELSNTSLLYLSKNEFCQHFYSHLLQFTETFLWTPGKAFIHHNQLRDIIFTHCHPLWKSLRFLQWSLWTKSVWFLQWKSMGEFPSIYSAEQFRFNFISEFIGNV